VSLLSLNFRVTAIVAAAVVAVLTFMLWNRLPGHQSVRLAARTLMVLTGQALATLAMLAWLNVAYGGLFVSWSDLLGNESMNGAHFAGQQGDVLLHPMAPGDAQVDGSARPVIPAIPFAPRQEFRQAGYGGFEETSLTGARSGMKAQVFVWTPPQYAQEPHQDFPVLMLLHGIPGNPQGWLGPMNVVAHLEAAMATGTVHPYILVVPSITPSTALSAPWNTPECSNVPGYANVATWLTDDVRSLVLDHYRALSSGLGWGVMGYSTGGFCAAKLVLQYPELFQAAVSLSGYYAPESLLLTRNPKLDRENSPQWLLGHTRTPAVSLLMTGSDQDMADPVSEITQLLAAAKANPLSRATEVRSFVAPIGGGHNQSAWEKMLPTAFTWLSERLSGPRPTDADGQRAMPYPDRRRTPRPAERPTAEHRASEHPPSPRPHSTAPATARPAHDERSPGKPSPGTPSPSRPSHAGPSRTGLPNAGLPSSGLPSAGLLPATGPATSPRPVPDPEPEIVG
jgi:enterochelin esterase-like enzyme